jgi:hypothetical protein
MVGAVDTPSRAALFEPDCASQQIPCSADKNSLLREKNSLLFRVGNFLVNI